MENFNDLDKQCRRSSLIYPLSLIRAKPEIFKAINKKSFRIFSDREDENYEKQDDDANSDNAGMPLNQAAKRRKTGIPL